MALDTEYLQCLQYTIVTFRELRNGNKKKTYTANQVQLL